MMASEHAKMPRKARAILNRMVEGRVITNEGLNFLICATDPFHDTEVRCDGYPDVTTARSVVQVVTKTVSIPVYTGGAGAWDCQVFFAPLTPCWTQDEPPVEQRMTKRNSATTISTDEPAKKKMRIGDTNVLSRNYYRTTVNHKGNLNQTGSGLQVNAGWNIKTGPVGFNWMTGAVGDESFAVALPAQFCTGAWRLLATGCEVTNTTAMLYKGGSVTSYRSPSASVIGCPLSIPDVLATNALKLGLTPPGTQDEASLYPNSRTWEAEKGVYMIATLNDHANPLFAPSPGFGGLLTPSSLQNLEDGDGWVGYLPRIDGAGIASAASSVLPFDINGCVFGGLNNQTTLQVTVRYYIERHPTVADPDILVLARTPAPYDPVVLELYSRVLNELPVAVPVGENPLGEWFNDVLSGVAEWAPKLGEFIGTAVPGAGIIGKTVGRVANLALQNRTVNPEKPKGPPPLPPKPRKPGSPPPPKGGAKRKRKRNRNKS